MLEMVAYLRILGHVIISWKEYKKRLMELNGDWHEFVLRRHEEWELKIDKGG